MRRRLLIICVVGAAVLLLAELFGPGGRQRRGMEAAESFRQSVAPALAADPRFAAIEMSITTHPSLFIRGDVPDEAALTDLQGMVQPPADASFAIIMHAKVAAEPTTRSAD